MNSVFEKFKEFELSKDALTNILGGGPNYVAICPASNTLEDAAQGGEESGCYGGSNVSMVYGGSGGSNTVDLCFNNYPPGTAGYNELVARYGSYPC